MIESRTILSLISLVSYVLTKVAVTVYSGGVVFGTVFGIEQISVFGYTFDFFWVSAIGLVVITGIYTIVGGMKAVMYTSVLQTPVLLIGSVVILVVGLIKVGGWGEVERLCGDNIHLIRSAANKDFPWTGVLFGSMIIGFWYWCTDQYIVQRVLSGRNQREARRGSILAGYFKLLPVFLFLIPGMIAFALYQKGLLTLPNNTITGLPDADKAFSSLVAQFLPIGFKGIVVCGLIAALMSSLSSLFNSSAALFVGDFYKKIKPESSEKHLLKVGRIATAVIVILGILWIPVMKGMGNVLYQYLQSVQGYLAPAIAVVFIFGVFWKKASAKAGLWTLIVGFSFGIFRLFLDVIKGSLPVDSFLYEMADINWLHYGEILFVLCGVIMVLVSKFTKSPTAAQQDFTIYAASESYKKETRASWNKWDVIHSVIILGITVAFYIYFW